MQVHFYFATPSPDSVAGCAASANLVFILDTTPILTVVSKTCDANNNFYSVYLTTDAPFVSADAGNLTHTGNTVQITNVPISHTLFIGANSSHHACSNALDITPPVCNCTLMIEDLVDTLTLCPGDSFRLIPFVTGAAGFPTTYWININNQDTVKHFSFEVSEPGTYIWVVIDTLQCEERDTFTAVFIGPTAIDFTSIPPTCPNETDGQIIINDVINGLPPYSIQLDNEAPVAVGVFPYPIPDVGLGSHVVAITDLTGCTFEQPVTVSSNAFGNVDLGPDITITKGDSTLIQPEVNNINVSSVQWNLPFLSPGLEPFWIKPDTTTLLQVTITDTAGCIYTDNLIITVIEKANFFVPNVFSPNDDQINDVITVNTNVPANRLVSFEIFDRWGGMLHRQVNNPPFSWDGKTDGRKLNPGVYVYKLTYLDDNDNQKIKIGDITLVR
jgi:gliding motility-associated-like protein